MPLSLGPLSLWDACGRLLWGWWRTDRLRVSSAGGWLLTIQRGSRLLVAGVPFRVLECTRRVHASAVQVVYHGVCRNRTCQLEVRRTDPQALLEVIFAEGASVQLLAESDVEVLGDSTGL